MAKVLVGMSGGVDSSVAAHLLMKQGFEVEGLSFILWDARSRTSPATCCSLEAIGSAAQTAEKLGITHTAVDVRNEFVDKVVEPFVGGYTRGMTPNPCILCNKYIKFPFLLREAQKRGAQYIATGHYAIVSECQGAEDNAYCLKKGVDPKKDQSYFLYVLGQDILRRLLLPLGGYRKDEIRTIARSLGLAAAERTESQEICFIAEGNYSRFIEQLSPEAGKPGPILDSMGQVVGTHKGIYCYTMGQRKGLNIASLEPRYVTRIDPEKNAVYAGSREEAQTTSFFVGDLNWILKPEGESFKATIKVRSMMEARPGLVSVLKAGVKVVFAEPLWAPAPGQSAVFYEGDAVIGGGVIVNRMQADER